MNTHHGFDADIVIAGGSFVGLALALALAGPKGDATGLRVIVVDAQPQGAGHAPDRRASAITAASRRMLLRLGAWGDLDRLGQPVTQMVVTDSALDQTARIPFLVFDTDAGADDGAPAAVIVENEHLRAALVDAVAANRSIQMIAPASVVTLARDATGVTLKLADSGARRARLAVAADGARSALRKAAGIKTVDWDYDQWGLVATLRLEREHESRAVQHFLPAGPFAMLPLPGRRGSLVWSERSAAAHRLLGLDEPSFVAELTRRLGHGFGAVALDGPRQGFPLSFSIARAFVAERLALAGDAAHRCHPLAGQGINLGLKDAAALAEVVLEAARLGRDIGSLAVLERYQRWRRFDAASLGAATDALNRLFSNDSEAVRVVRDIGLGLVERMPALKRFFVREAAGDTGAVPRLLRGEAV